MQEYKILMASEMPTTLEREVNNYLKQGWELAGPLSVISAQFGAVQFYQPIIRNQRGVREG